MKHRITYLLHDPNGSFDPSQLNVSGQIFSVKNLKAAKEHRITLGFDELPQELLLTLKQCYELHIRWSEEHTWTAYSPFNSLAGPGLHVLFTPHQKVEASRVCPILKKVFSNDLKCDSPQETFIGLPILSERFSTTSSFQYYYRLPLLRELVTYIQQKICPTEHSACYENADTLLSASYVDFDYDSISHTLIVKAYWSASPTTAGWTEAITSPKADESIEIGVLGSEKPDEHEELKLGGFLTILGRDDHPKPTRFSFPARHHPLPSFAPATFKASFKTPTGLHPTLQLTFPRSNLKVPFAGCALHSYFTLPSHMFIDRYAFADPLFLSSMRIRQLRSISGETDLEAPDYVIKKWGSTALFEIAYPRDFAANEADWEVSIPLHLRYVSPSHNTSGLEHVSIPWPAVFWACAAEEGTKMSVNPFDRVNLGYDGLFGDRTMFYHVPPDAVGNGSGGLIGELTVPVLDMDRAAYVEWGTVAAVVVGITWVCWKLYTVMTEQYTRKRK
ncbi:PIG-X-domain-containing protein [Patellaria atrata CBS 101060]|uniref:Protein PBN1 n=1 Tax=Patellaria atrata CBS 101060 TaxID=1346257 RepID=A0A9P4SFR8_9PEZI|nr:PIG-X-domain-containing protein [Patellaria atrata CBS 101060]